MVRKLGRGDSTIYVRTNVCADIQANVYLHLFI